MAYAYLSGTQCQPKRRRFSGDRRRHSTALTIQQVAAFPDFVEVIAKYIAYNFGYAVIFSLSYVNDNYHLSNQIWKTLQSQKLTRNIIYTIQQIFIILQARKLSGKALSVPALSRSPSPPSLRSGSASRYVEEKITVLFCNFTNILSIRREYRGGVHNEVASRWEAIINNYAQISKLLLFHYFGNHPKLFLPNLKTSFSSEWDCSFTILATTQHCFAKPQNFFLIRVELLFHFFGNHPKLFYQTSKLLSHQSGVAFPAGGLKWLW